MYDNVFLFKEDLTVGQFTVLSAVGDINLGDRALMVGLGLNSLIRQDSSYDPFDHVKTMLSGSDLVFGNLECVVSDRDLDNTRVESRIMKAAPASVQLLKSAGFDLLSVANNHVMQHGKDCFIDTVDAILNEGMLPIGLAGKEGRSLPIFVTDKALRFGFLGYCLRPEKYTAPPLYAQSQLSRILEEIEVTRLKCDFLIVSLHWGDEYMDYPSAWQIKAAHAMIDRGASVILGHHPHVLQGVEKYNGGIIAYSLGNFVFDVRQRRLRETMILRITFSNEGINTVDRVPVYIAANFSPQPVPLGRKKQHLLERFNGLDEWLCRYPQSPVFVDNAYRKKVRWAERINQFHNRMLFLRQLPKYERNVSLQCLSAFVRARLKE